MFSDPNQVKGQQLLDEGRVRDEGDGTFTVESSMIQGWRYFCYPKTQSSPARCDCPDYRRQSKQDPAYRCKHLWAVRLYVQAQRAAQAPKEQTRTAPKPPSAKKDAKSMEQHIQEALQRQPCRRALAAHDRHEEAARRLDAGTGDEFTEAQLWQAFNECIDLWPSGEDEGEAPPNGLAFVEAG